MNVFAVIWLGVCTAAVANDYAKLKAYADIMAVSYCLKYDLQNTVFQNSNCPLALCHQYPYEDIEIVQVFNYNEVNALGSGFYALDHQKNQILLAFRGTTSRRDWFANVNAVPVPYEPLINLKRGSSVVECHNCEVHRGFYSFLKKNLESILITTQKLKLRHPDYKLVVMGHSLGGALAALAGVEFQLMGYEPLVVSFASPKIGNAHLSRFIDGLFDTATVTKKIQTTKDFDSGLIRVVHKNDIVPLLPPFSRFTHAGFEYSIDKRKLPHEEHDLNRGGSSADAYSSSSLKLGNLWPSTVAKYEHVHYFRRISGCHDEAE